MKLSVIEASDRLIDLINPDRPEVFEVEDPLMGPIVSNPKHMITKIILEESSMTVCGHVRGIRCG